MQPAMQTEAVRVATPAITEGARLGLMALLVTAPLALSTPAAAQSDEDGESEPAMSAAAPEHGADDDEPSGCSGPSSRAASACP